MFSRLLIIAGLLFQPLLVVPTCACIQSTPTDCHCTSTACCVSPDASAKVDAGNCCSQSAKTCCNQENSSAESSCRKFNSPVSLMALADGGCSCTCCCCSRPLAPVAGETQSLVESTSASHSYSPPPHAVTANLPTLTANQHDSGLALKSYGTTQSRLCVWLN